MAAPRHREDTLVARQLAREYDAGMIVIHGVGNHAARGSLHSFAEPFMARLQAERALTNSVGLTVGGPETRGGPFESIDVTLADPPARLLIVEGRWHGVFDRAGERSMSAWALRHLPRMMWTLARYYARSAFDFIAALLVVAPLGVAVWAAINDRHNVAAGAAMLGLASGFLKVLFGDARGVWSRLTQPDTSMRQRLLILLAAISATSVFLVYQIQRGLAVPIVLVGIPLMIVVIPVTRFFASIPLLKRPSWWFFDRVEAALLTGGAADLEALEDDLISSALIRQRLRAALIEVESRVRAGGTITIVAHSGGALPAWRMLSEPETQERVSRAPWLQHRYQLITVGAALNWAGFDIRGRDATPIGDPLVGSGPLGGVQVRWLNVYSTWDFVPHGGVNVERAPFSGSTGSWTAWDRGGPNRMIRNLGAPVPDEHGEYWANQEEFVPLIGRAVTPDAAWVRKALEVATFQTGTAARLAMLSTLIRVRFMLLALALTAFAVFSLELTSDGPNMFDTFARQMDRLPGVLEGRLDRRALNETHEECLERVEAPGESDVCDTLQRVLRELHRNDIAANAVVSILLLLIAHVATGVYTDLFWARIARGALPFGAARFPLLDVCFALMPGILLPLWPLLLDVNAWFLSLGVANMLLTVAEGGWLVTTYRGFHAPSGIAGQLVSQPLGRAIERRSRYGLAWRGRWSVRIW